MTSPVEHVAYAVLHEDPPRVFIASNDAVLSRLLAVKVVAASDPSEFANPATLESVRSALLTERWADAVSTWIQVKETPIDAFPDETVVQEEHLDEDAASFEIRMAPIFRDGR